MEKIEDGGPAFPVEVQFMPDGTKQAIQTGHMTGWASGLSIRDYFAIHADVPWNAVIETLSLQGRSRPTIQEMSEYRAKLKYAESDAMLKARKGETS